MWARGAQKVSVLDRAKAQLSGKRFSDNSASKEKSDEGVFRKSGISHGEVRIRDVGEGFSSSWNDEVQEEEKTSFSMGGGSRFLKKKRRSSDQSSENEAKITPPHSSHCPALKKLELIEKRLSQQKNQGEGSSLHTTLSRAQQTRSSSSMSLTTSRFLKEKRKTISTSPSPLEGRELRSPPHEREGGSVSVDSDEQDMRRLLGDSFSLSESSLKNITGQIPTSANQSYRKSREKPAAERPETFPQSSTPEPSRGVALLLDRSLSPESVLSEIRSLDDLFPVALRPASDDTVSECSDVSEDFKRNIMSLDDLLPVHRLQESAREKDESQTRQEFVDKKPNQPPQVLLAPAAEPLSTSYNYESDFESEIQSEAEPSASKISECVTEEDEEQSVSRSHEEDDAPSSESVRRRRDSDTDCSSRSSSSQTCSSGPRVKQTQTDGLVYSWFSGLAAPGPSLGMTYVDPTPIASHTVSADALEGLTSYNPAVVALNHMLRQQLALTNAFIQTSRRHYASVLESLGPADYQYTTLKEAKEFIRTHKPSKRR